MWVTRTKNFIFSSTTREFCTARQALFMTAARSCRPYPLQRNMQYVQRLSILQNGAHELTRLQRPMHSMSKIDVLFETREMYLQYSTLFYFRQIFEINIRSRIFRNEPITASFHFYKCGFIPEDDIVRLLIILDCRDMLRNIIVIDRWTHIAL